jgi:hypothetical protein
VEFQSRSDVGTVAELLVTKTNDSGDVSLRSAIAQPYLFIIKCSLRSAIEAVLRGLSPREGDRSLETLEGAIA